ncbi:hypothetical protein QTP70_001844 [Hemibagrus guttatus]|uniref:USP domain-containing protein n=1 Tax=Hemibagrus guttatus TaxID=175788 RepID=A0AAE0VFM3_9TELE|nr:hypothetical protein QTP70_001844 [Hemibagrus guttatus]
MPGLQSEGAAVGVGSPVRKNRLSLKFLQRKETKRALDFTEPQAEDPNTAEPADTTRQLNPMYEGYLQHDAQEVLQCILAYIQEACDTIKKELKSNPDEKPGESEHVTRGETTDGMTPTREEEESSDGQLSGKRKSDTEVGNAKKKPKSQSKPKKSDEENRPFTRSKRKSSGGDVGNSVSDQTDVPEKDKEEKEGGSNTEEEKSEGTAKEPSKRKRAKLNWLKPSGKQPSIFSKFRSMGRISSHVGDRTDRKDQDMSSSEQSLDKTTPKSEKTIQKQTAPKTEEAELRGLDMLKQLFQGQLVLRTRCLECECYTERREDFQDISVPVQEDETSCPEPSSEISPDPKPERKTLRWAISQFASVERIVGQDKYFCETCHHYTEAERSLLFDKTPDVVTIHLKCFAASGLEMDPYAGLSKVNTPLLTPLKLSLDEWSTRPSSSHEQHHYRLFAVVMHSGVTINSGHYTTYVHMMDLHRTKLELQSQEESLKEEDGETKPLKKEEVSPPDYDDGEVSFSVSSKVKNMTNGSSLSSKGGGKRSTEGVSLLGGQRSISSYEISASKQAASEKPANMAAYAGSPVQNGVLKKERDEGGDVVKEESQVSLDMALQNLLDYEGKWVLFDDSEVRLFEEEEFLRVCSPDTCSTSTPYLLFYKKVSGEMN